MASGRRPRYHKRGVATGVGSRRFLGCCWGRRLTVLAAGRIEMRARSVTACNLTLRGLAGAGPFVVPPLSPQPPFHPRRGGKGGPDLASGRRPWHHKRGVATGVGSRRFLGGCWGRRLTILGVKWCHRLSRPATACLYWGRQESFRLSALSAGALYDRRHKVLAHTGSGNVTPVVPWPARRNQMRLPLSTPAGVERGLGG